MTPTGAQSDIVHATCVALGSQGALILGPSGSGKSALAIDLVSRGCTLISDDRTRLTARAEGVIAEAPGPTGKGLIEARGIGLLAVPHSQSTWVRLVVDLGQKARDRLPGPRVIKLLEREIELIEAAGHGQLGPVIHLMLLGGRVH